MNLLHHPVHENLIPSIIASAQSIIQELGPTHSEQTYQNALELELQERAISYQRQPTFTIYYKKKAVGFHRPDLVIEGRLIVELKCRKNDRRDQANEQLWESQIKQYLKCVPLCRSLTEPETSSATSPEIVGMILIFNSTGHITVRCFSSTSTAVHVDDMVQPLNPLNENIIVPPNYRSSRRNKKKSSSPPSANQNDQCIFINVPEKLN